MSSCFLNVVTAYRLKPMHVKKASAYGRLVEGGKIRIKFSGVSTSLVGD